MSHLINRTSPKGQPFIGTCALCGKTGLRLEQVNEDCENIRGLSREEAVVEAIIGRSPLKGDGMSDLVERLRAHPLLDGTVTEQFREMVVQRTEAADEIERLEGALRRIIQWAEAYPIDIFHEPTKEEHHKAHELLTANGMTLDAFSASMGRRCLQGVAEIARAAIAKGEGGK